MWGSDHVCKEFWIPAYGFWELLWKERLWCSTLAAGPRAKGFPEKQRNAIKPKQSQKVGSKCSFSLFVRILSVQGDTLDSLKLTSWIQSFVSNKGRLGVLNWFGGQPSAEEILSPLVVSVYRLGSIKEPLLRLWQTWFSKERDWKRARVLEYSKLSILHILFWKLGVSF